MSDGLNKKARELLEAMYETGDSIADVDWDASIALIAKALREERIDAMQFVFDAQARARGES